MTAPTVYPTWTAPIGWLYGRVITADPGYRQVQVGVTVRTVASGAYWWHEFVTALNATLATAGWAAAADAQGRVTLSGSSAVITWPDRAGWLCGFDSEPADAEVAAASLTSRAVSPAALPLYSAVRRAVGRDQERQLKLNRHGRGHGYVFGAADIWRWTVRLHRTGLEALESGWCKSGRVLVSPYTVAQHQAGSAVAWTAAASFGYVEGKVLGLDGGRWLDAARQLYEVDLIMTTAVV